MEELENAGLNVDTATTDVEETQTENEELNERTFSQDEVNEIVRTRLERERNKSRASFYEELGIKDKSEYDDIVGRSSAYDVMVERYANLENTNKELERKILFIEKNINQNKKDDVVAYFKGKELELNNENLTNELATHPEWLNVPNTKTIEVLGEQRGHIEPEDERKKAMKLFGFKD